MSQRDFQRSKVYNLDSALPASARRASFSLEECTELIHKAHRYYGLRWTGRVKDGRGTTMARGSAIWISLPKWSRSTCVVLHESAHAIHHQLFRATWQSETVPHGAEFTRIMIELWAMDDPIMLEHLIHAAGMRGIYVSANPRVLPPERSLVDQLEAAKARLASAKDAVNNILVEITLLEQKMRGSAPPPLLDTRAPSNVRVAKTRSRS